MSQKAQDQGKTGKQACDAFEGLAGRLRLGSIVRRRWI